jgi:hypothetical protein
MKISRLLLIMVVLLTASLLTAQDGSYSLLIRTETSIKAWSNGTVSSLHCTPGDPSPTGRYVTYSTMPKFFSDGLERVGGIGGAAFANNLSLCNTATGEIFSITDQPADASFYVEGVPDRWIARSAVAWSPDGQALAWTESDYPVPENNTIRLIVFGIGQPGEIIAEAPGIPGPPMPSPVDVQWGDGGIAIPVEQYDSEIGGFTNTFQIYRMDGTLTSTFDATLKNDYLLTWLWVDVFGQPQIAIQYEQAGWYMADPVTGVVQPMNGLPVLVNLVNPYTTPSLLLVDTRHDDTWWILDGELPYLGSDNQPFTFSTSALDDVALSPAGDIAIVSDHIAQIFQNGRFANLSGLDATIDRVESVQWGPTLWRVWKAASTVQSSGDCADVPPSYLKIGEQGWEITGSPNNIRAEPSTSAGIFGHIPGYGGFTVLSGPVCAEGMHWWYVDVDGLIGWSADGNGTDRWLETAMP